MEKEVILISHVAQLFSFNGSANESHAGLMTQGENFDVYDSRKGKSILESG
jgi:hypothetical protein